MNINKFDDYFWTTKPQLGTPTQPKAHRLQMDAGCWQTELSLPKKRKKKKKAEYQLTLYLQSAYLCVLSMYVRLKLTLENTE